MDWNGTDFSGCSSNNRSDLLHQKPDDLGYAYPDPEREQKPRAEAGRQATIQPEKRPNIPAAISCPGTQIIMSILQKSCRAVK
jgi:hypothetical protein